MTSKLLVFRSLFERECYAFLDNNPHINGIIEKDLFSGYFQVLDLG